MNAELTNLIRPYAGWAALVLLVIAIFSGIFSANYVVPLTLFGFSASLAAFRFWEPLRTFDFWAFDEWARTRYNALDVREWQAPHHAAELYCSQVLVKTRNDAAAEMNVIMMELIRGQERTVSASNASGIATPTELRMFEGNRTERNARYDAAQIRYNQCNAALSRELLEQLAHGVLLAKGLPTRDDIAQSERIIPTSRWRVMSLDIAKAKATGSGWEYMGIVIGKRPAVRRKAKTAAPRTELSATGDKSTTPRPQRPDEPRRPNKPLA